MATKIKRPLVSGGQELSASVEPFQITVRMGPRRTAAGVGESAADVGTIRKSTEHGLPEFRYADTWLSAHQLNPHFYFNIDPLLQMDRSWQRVDTGGFLADAELGSFECNCMPRMALPLPSPTSSLLEWSYFSWNKWALEFTGLPPAVRFGALQFLNSHPHYHLDEPSIPSSLQIRFATGRLRKALSGKEFKAPQFWAGPSLPGYDADAKIAATIGNRLVTYFLPLTETGGFSSFPAWMAVQLAVAKAAGINVCDFGMAKSKAPILYLERFDRDNGRVIPCMLAITAAKKRPFNRTSYVEMAEIMSAWSSQSDDDLRELWRRMVFGILANFIQPANTIALVWHSGGWKLAPMWYVQPPGGRASKNPPNRQKAIELQEDDFLRRSQSWPLRITREVKASSLGLAFSVAEGFRLSESQAQAIAGDVAVAVKAWPKHAAVYKLRDVPSLKLAGELYKSDDLEAAYGHATKAQRKRRRNVGRG